MKLQIASRVIQCNASTSPVPSRATRYRRFYNGLTCFKLAVLVVLFVITAAPTRAQVIPGFLEGPLSDVDVAGRTARVNGVLMNIPVGTPMSSPTVDFNALAATQGVDALTLLVGTPLPGRSMPGFTGGTCLCATEVDPVTGIVTATNMVLEPSENVILAAVTTHKCLTPSCDPDDNPLNELRVGGILLNPNSDVRLVSDPTTNRGFEVNLMLGNLVGVGAGAEGYMGNTGNLHLYLLEVSGGILVNAGVTEVSILRARCRQRGDIADWTVLGATHDPGAGMVTLRRSDTGAVLGSTPVVADATDPKFGAYLFSADVTGTCTDSIISDFGTATTTSGVDVRGGAMALAAAPAVVLQTRAAGNALPVTTDDIFTTAVNIESTFGGLFLLGNDTDAENDTLTIVSVSPTSAKGGTVADNMDGTFTYTPAPGFSGADTFTYMIADGFIPAVVGSVNVTVETPVVDNLVVQRALFQADTGEWRIRGTSSIGGSGNTVTIYLGATVGGQVIGSVTVDMLGSWEFRGQNALINLGLETTVSVSSTANGVLEGFPLTFK